MRRRQACKNDAKPMIKHDPVWIQYKIGYAGLQYYT